MLADVPLVFVLLRFGLLFVFFAPIRSPKNVSQARLAA
jgi:hypothetical protein